ncbi:MAG: SDR family oxidoreductase [Ruminococcaceae bacterium]|nr:SDR family oxidoreductase [Oscillospiraceae bacterium]
MKRILISGGSRGIGRGLVEAFRQNGDKVVFIYKSNHEAAREVAKATGAVAIQADVADPHQVRRAVEEAENALGGHVDVLVNNAGVSLISVMQDVTDIQWREVLDTNLSGAFYLSREVLSGMISAKNGRIIHIGSMWGKVGASCEVAYSAAKAGLRGLTLSMAKELAPSGITVNCVEPGVINTAMNAKLGAETLAALVEDTPVGRLGTPADVSAAVLFLASEAASFITGQCLSVDGGFAL